jgi:hypothetical protein
MRIAVRLAIIGLVLSPAVTGAVPVPRERFRETIEVAGTTWEGIDGPQGELGLSRFTFEPNGVLAWTTKHGSFRTASWKLEGDVLYFQQNNKYREFRGTIQGDVVTGDSWNVAGARWLLSIRRLSGPK